MKFNNCGLYPNWNHFIIREVVGSSSSAPIFYLKTSVGIIVINPFVGKKTLQEKVHYFKEIVTLC